MRTTSVMTILTMAGCATSVLAQATVPATAVLKEGDFVNVGGVPTAITDLGDPYTNGLGQFGCTYTAGTGRGIWIENASVFDATSNPGLTGAEGTMGISDAGGFLYSPALNGNDGVYSNFGPLLFEGEVAPGFPLRNVTFGSRPRMVASGTAAWVGGMGAEGGGTSTAVRVFYINRNPSSPTNTVPTIVGGDVVDGQTVAVQGIGFAYDISDDGTKYINALTLVAPTTSDAAIATNGNTIIMREGSPSSAPGENWQNFAFVGINNAGDTVVAGDTDTVTNVDGFIAVNGQMRIREGEVIGPGTLSGAYNAVSISNQGKVGFISTVNGLESLVVGNASDLSAATATVLLQVLDQVDLDGDTIADATVDDFNASTATAPGLDLADDGRVLVNVDITPFSTGVQIEAIIALAFPGAGSGCDTIDFNGDGLFPDDQDLVDFLSVFAGGACSTGTCGDIDFNNDGLFPDDADLVAFLTVLAGGNC